MSLACPCCGTGAEISFRSPLTRYQLSSHRCPLANLESHGPHSDFVVVHLPLIDLRANCYRCLEGGFEGHCHGKSYLNQHSPLDP